jgi:hypothetical protein
LDARLAVRVIDRHGGSRAVAKQGLLFAAQLGVKITAG